MLRKSQGKSAMLMMRKEGMGRGEGGQARAVPGTLSISRHGRTDTPHHLPKDKRDMLLSMSAGLFPWYITNASCLTPPSLPPIPLPIITGPQEPPCKRE